MFMFLFSALFCVKCTISDSPTVSRFPQIQVQLCASRLHIRILTFVYYANCIILTIVIWRPQANHLIIYRAQRAFARSPTYIYNAQQMYKVQKIVFHASAVQRCNLPPLSCPPPPPTFKISNSLPSTIFSPNHCRPTHKQNVIQVSAKKS